MNRDNEKLYLENQADMDSVKIQNDLLKLIEVLDECIENADNFYCYSMKKQFLSTSTNN